MAEATSQSGTPRRRTKRRGAKVVCVLSRKKTLYSTRRLVEATRQLGHRPIVVDTMRCNLVVEKGAHSIGYGPRPLPRVDVVVPRIGASVTSYGLAVVRHFQLIGVPSLNRALAIGRSRDKLRSLQLLAQAGLDVPKTVLAHRRTDVATLARQVGGLPAIVKLIQGTQGVGVMLATSLQELQTLLDTFWDLGHDILLQELVEESRGRDVRALVVGDQVVAAMRRQARAGEFRSNIHRGGEGKPVELTAEYAQVAVRAARAVGLEVAGVDLLESKRGPLPIEVNSSPGFEGIEAATGLDVAGAIIARAIDLAR